MALILKLDLDRSRCTCIPKMKFLCQGVQKLKPEQTETDRQTDRQTEMTENITYLHTLVVIISNYNGTHPCMTPTKQLFSQLKLLF